VWLKKTWQHISTEVIVNSFKKCCISNAKDGTDGGMLWKGTKKDGKVRVSVRKMKALNVKINRVTMIGKGRQNLTHIMY
jgi:hypothetical protein